MTDQPVGPRCGNNPNTRLTPGDRKAVDDFKARLALQADAKPYIERAAWVDFDPLMEVIAATVWKHCGRDSEDMPQLVCDDPRTIAAFAAAVARAHAAVPAPAADQAALRQQVIEALYDARRPGLGGMTEAEAVAHMADAVLSVLPAPAEEHRVALCDALGLGTGAPWDAICDRATELALPPLDRDPVAQRLGLLPAPADRAAVLRELEQRQRPNTPPSRPDASPTPPPVKQRADCTELEWAVQERARFEQLYTRETVRADLAEQRADTAARDADIYQQRLERLSEGYTEQRKRAEAMERAMESTAADALTHRGCHRDLMAQCQRAERAEAEAEHLRVGRAEVPLSPFYEHPECGFRWHGSDDMDVPMRDGQPVCPRCELARQPTVADRTAVLREAAERVTGHAADHFPEEFDQYADQLADVLRRMADETQQPEAEGQAPDVVAAIVAALQERAGELSELAEDQMRPSLEERAQEWLEAAEMACRAAKAAAAAPEPFTPAAHYRRDDGVDCCVHAIPVGPDSCLACRELHDDEPPAVGAQQPKEA